MIPTALTPSCQYSFDQRALQLCGAPTNAALLTPNLLLHTACQEAEGGLIPSPSTYKKTNLSLCKYFMVWKINVHHSSQFQHVLLY